MIMYYCSTSCRGVIKKHVHDMGKKGKGGPLELLSTQVPRGTWTATMDDFRPRCHRARGLQPHEWFSNQAQILLLIRLKELHARTVGFFFRAACGLSLVIYMGNGIGVGVYFYRYLFYILLM